MLTGLMDLPQTPLSETLPKFNSGNSSQAIPGIAFTAGTKSPAKQIAPIPMA